MRIFIDMDEVMADAYNAHIEWYNKEFHENLTREACMGKEVIDSVPQERRQSVWDHLFADGFFRNLNPIDGAKEVIRELQNAHEVYVATAATQFPNSLREKSDWLDEHFPFIPWQNRILCGHKHVLKGDVLI
ncbi:MAG: 5'(3')-deoxyribonucleotidase, partial [Flavobacteriaceae bacterium]